MIPAACDRSSSDSPRTVDAGSSSSTPASSPSDASATAAGPDATTGIVLLRYTVGGMHCNGCSGAIAAKVTEIAGVRRAEVDHESGIAEIEVTDESLDGAIRAAVERLGYTISRGPSTTEASEAPRAGG